MISGAVAAPGTSSVIGLIGSTGTTTFVLVVLLVALGTAMVSVAVWLVRSTRSDVPALAPLEVMGDRGFTKAAPDDRGAKLTAVRPEGAPPPAPMIAADDDDAADAPATEPVSAEVVEPVEVVAPVEAAEAVPADAAVADDGSR